MTDLGKSEGSRKKLGEAMVRIADAGTATIDGELMVTGGFRDEDEYGHDAWRLTAWHCYTATLHTDSVFRDINCWSNYECVLVYRHPQETDLA